MNRIKQARTDQGQGHYLCSLQGAVVEIRTEVEQRGSRERSLRVARLSARGISIATAKTSVNARRHRRTYRQEPGHKGALAVRLRKLAIDGEKPLQGVAELAYQQSFQV